MDVDAAVARTSFEPAHLKPSRDLVTQALDTLEANRRYSVLAGDSIGDLTAALAAGSQASDTHQARQVRSARRRRRDCRNRGRRDAIRVAMQVS
jgi:histidinol phosphatase-like enzyme